MSIELRAPNPDNNAWDPPQIIKLERGDTRVVEAWRDQPGIRVVDNITAYTDEIAETHPSVVDELSEGVSYGNWVYDPTSRTVDHLPDAQSFFELRTSRFSPRITPEEQINLGRVRYAALGMSVGSSAVEAAFRAGIGSGPGGLTVIMDPKEIKPSNLGRIGTGRHDVGVPKVVSLARRLSSLDPYSKIMPIQAEFDAHTMADLEALDLDALIEEMDNTHAKVLSRYLAMRQEMPVFMGADLLDANAVSVERYDQLQPDGTLLPPFGGRVPRGIFEGILNGGIKPNGEPVTPQDMIAATVGIAGYDAISNASPELLKYHMQVMNGELPGIPQYNTTVNVGSAAIAVALREAMLGRTMDSGTYTIDMRQQLGLDSLVDPQEAAMLRGQLQQIVT